MRQMLARPHWRGWDLEVEPHTRLAVHPPGVTLRLKPGARASAELTVGKVVEVNATLSADATGLQAVRIKFER